MRRRIRWQIRCQNINFFSFIPTGQKSLHFAFFMFFWIIIFFFFFFTKFLIRSEVLLFSSLSAAFPWFSFEGGTESSCNVLRLVGLVGHRHDHRKVALPEVHASQDHKALGLARTGDSFLPSIEEVLVEPALVVSFRAPPKPCPEAPSRGTWRPGDCKSPSRLRPWPGRSPHQCRQTRCSRHRRG